MPDRLVNRPNRSWKDAMVAHEKLITRARWCPLAPGSLMASHRVNLGKAESPPARVRISPCGANRHVLPEVTQPIMSSPTVAARRLVEMRELMVCAVAMTGLFTGRP
jgi:hypothetical protein